MIKTIYYVATEVHNTKYYLNFRNTSDPRYNYQSFSFEGLRDNASSFTVKHQAETARDLAQPRTKNLLFVFDNTKQKNHE